MTRIAWIAFAILVGSVPACLPRPAESTPITAVHTPGDWLAAEPGACGEVRGRIINGESGEPLVGAYVAFDSTGRAVSTDRQGHFRLKLPADTTRVPSRGTTLRVRRIGFFDLRVYLPPGLGYTVDVTLAPRVFHVDHISSVRIKDFGFCARAT